MSDAGPARSFLAHNEHDRRWFHAGAPLKRMHKRGTNRPSFIQIKFGILSAFSGTCGPARGGGRASSSPAFRGRGWTQGEGLGGEGLADSAVQTLTSHRFAAGPSSPAKAAEEA